MLWGSSIGFCRSGRGGGITIMVFLSSMASYENQKKIKEYILTEYNQTKSEFTVVYLCLGNDQRNENHYAWRIMCALFSKHQS